MTTDARVLSTIRRTVESHLRALALDPRPEPGRGRGYHLALLGLHLGGLLLVARLAHWPLWSAPLLLGAFSLPQLLRRRWPAESLAPLALLYGVAAARLALIYGLRAESIPPALDYRLALGLGTAWATLIALRAAGRLWLAWPLAAAAAAGVMAFQLWRLAPAGVTGSDPFAYVQMALDLAQRGTPLHHFPLVGLAARLGLPTLPVTHVGYVLPNAAGDAPTVWPVGFSALLAAAYRLAGEQGLLGLNGWIGLASLGATGALTALLRPAGARWLGLAAGSAAVVILATSREQLTRLEVPMADGAAQLFTALAVVLALWALRSAEAPGRSPERLALLGALAGLALATAFSTRYTQALALPGLAVAGGFELRDRRLRLAFISALLAAALLGVLPDALYRTRLYGAPWRFGTGELGLFSVVALPAALAGLGRELLAPVEFGWLWPLALAGVLNAWRHGRPALTVVAAAYGLSLLFHLWYPFVRARDVLFVFVPLAACAGLGIVALGAWVWRQGLAPRLALIAGVLVLGALRLAPVLSLGPGFYTFGYLLPEQRRGLEGLAALTEPRAVIACSLNSGAVELYGRRLAIRPGILLQPGAGWSREQWLTFANALRAEGRPLYVLMDSPELDEPLAALRTGHALSQVAELPLPVYFLGGGSRNMTVPLYRVGP